MNKKLFAAAIIALSLSPVIWGEEAASLIAQADAAYGKREDIPQAKIAMIDYERAALLDTAQAETCYWKAARAAWWLAEHQSSRSDKLAIFQKGIEDAKKAIALNPNSVDGHFWLAGNEGSYGDTKGVMKSLSLVKPIRKELAEVIRLNDRAYNGGAYQVLGVVDYKVPAMLGGSKTRAKQELDKALVLGPKDPFNNYYMAEYYFMIGDKVNLKSQLDTLHTLETSPDLVPELKMLQARAEKELK